MKLENVKHYNEKTRALTLVTGIENHETKEVEVKEYQYPFFVKGIFTKKAIDLGAEIEENEYVVNNDLFDRLSNFIVSLYDEQFDKEELVNGIEQRVVINVFFSILFGVLQGDPKNG